MHPVNSISTRFFRPLNFNKLCRDLMLNGGKVCHVVSQDFVSTGANQKEKNPLRGLMKHTWASAGSKGFFITFEWRVKISLEFTQI